MKYETMTRQELADKMKISPRTLLRRMREELSTEFLKGIEGKILFENQVKHIHEQLTGLNKKW